MRDPAGRTGLSVRLRITVTVAVLVASALAGAGLTVYLVEDRRIDRERVASIEQEIAEFQQLAERGGPYAQPEPLSDGTPVVLTGVEELLYGFIASNVATDDEFLAVWWDDRIQFQQGGSGGLNATDSRSTRVVEDEEFAEVVRPLVAEGGSTEVEVAGDKLFVTVQPARSDDDSGALVVVTFMDNAETELADTMRTYTLVALVALLLVVGVAALQSGRLLRPLRVLRRTADEIGETDLSRRIPETGNDDITALTRTVNGMLARLESAFVGQRQFLDDAGHELKTPLTILRGHLELLDVDSAEAAETRDLLLDEIDRMARLVGDLLLLAKSDRPDFLSRGPVDVADLAVAVLAKARGLGDRAWALDTPVDGGGAVVRADEQRLTQALLQLAGNAVKHTRPGDEIAVGYDAVPATAGGPGAVRLWVRDSGPGVPAADRRLIFERFGRSAVPAGDEGFGLGLSIVHAIATAHGGTVTVEDAEPHGAVFVLTLPHES